MRRRVLSIAAVLAVVACGHSEPWPRRGCSGANRAAAAKPNGWLLWSMKKDS
jgi:hypothetical protein